MVQGDCPEDTVPFRTSDSSCRGGGLLKRVIGTGQQAPLIPVTPSLRIHDGSEPRSPRAGSSTRRFHHFPLRVQIIAQDRWDLSPGLPRFGQTRRGGAIWLGVTAVSIRGVPVGIE